MLDIINWSMSLGALFFQIIIFVLILFWFLGKKDNLISNFLRNKGMIIAYMISLLGVLGSLYYSDIAGFAPCVLCWYQRIFMYPLVFILGWAIYKNEDKNSIPYAIILAFVGTLISLYHNYLQFFSKESETCSIFSTVSCTENYFTVLGYLNIPSITLTAFIMIIICLMFARKK